ncbi:helix-turn-helix domain-containing protein [Pseudomonas sp. A1437]|uniref:helix-turn-helix domain-containing protein n=1 Tax=unclassified Pseudomonas TaxID=196821 RepID=UPI003783CCEF
MSKEFASKLVALRGEKNMTQQQLADAVGITPSQISRYESGTSKPRKTVMIKLAKALNVSQEELETKSAKTVVIGERAPITPPSMIRQKMLQELRDMDSDEIEAVKLEAIAAGVPFEQYICDEAEKEFLENIKQAALTGDSETASLFMVLARLMFGTNVKLVDMDKSVTDSPKD